MSHFYLTFAGMMGKLSLTGAGAGDYFETFRVPTLLTR